MQWTRWCVSIMTAVRSSTLFGMIGLVLEHFGKRKILRILAFLLLIASLIDVIPSMAYGLFTLPLAIALPAIFLLTVK